MRSQKWFNKTTEEVAPIGSINGKIDVTSRVVLRSYFSLRKAFCGFHKHAGNIAVVANKVFPLGLTKFTKPGLHPYQRISNKVVSIISIADKFMLLFQSFCQANFSFTKNGRQIVDQVFK